MNDRDDEVTPVADAAIADGAGREAEGGPADALSREEGRMLRVLGAALLVEWNVLPTGARKRLFEAAMSTVHPAGTASLKQKIARFLHLHKDDEPPQV